MKKYSLYVIAIPLAIATLALFVWLNQQNSANFIKPEDRKTALINMPSVAKQSPDELQCENKEEYGEFEKPVEVEWQARFTGCLSSCEGASFLRLPGGSNNQYLSFAGYFNEKIPQEFQNKEVSLKIYGEWIGVGDDYSRTVFAGRCVPIIGIRKIEILKEDDSVERYGMLLRSSTSGDVRFSYYDIGQKKSLESWEGRPWFFALANEEETEDYLKYIQEREGSVFKITGKKEADDCDYFGNGTCLESIAVEKIEVVAK